MSDRYIPLAWSHGPGGFVFDREGEKVVAYHEHFITCGFIATALEAGTEEERAKLLEMGEQTKAFFDGREVMEELGRLGVAIAERERGEG